MSGERGVKVIGEFSGLEIGLDASIELIGLEFLKPLPKTSHLFGRELLDGLFDVFEFGHGIVSMSECRAVAG
jgi:hypothetical protein